MPTSHLRVLVVDDNQDAAFSMSILLEHLGHTVRIAHDGESAVEMAASYQPEVVLLDIGLPKMTGYDVARAIRQTPWGQNVVLIAVTGWGQDEDKQKAKLAGFNRHMVKPVDPELLMQLLHEFSIDLATRAAKGVGSQ